MPKHLLLLRHAKTMPDDGSGDRLRALAERGREDAPLLGREIAKRGYAPALVLCSSARRTVETLGLIRPWLQPAPDEQIEGKLYLASANEILARAAEIPDDVPSALFIGHNPGLEEIAQHLAGEAPLSRRIGEKFPTSAFAAFESHEETWRDAIHSTWTLRDLIYPADL